MLPSTPLPLIPSEASTTQGRNVTSPNVTTLPLWYSASLSLGNATSNPTPESALPGHTVNTTLPSVPLVKVSCALAAVVLCLATTTARRHPLSPGSSFPRFHRKRHSAGLHCAAGDTFKICENSGGRSTSATTSNKGPGQAGLTE